MWGERVRDQRSGEEFVVAIGDRGEGRGFVGEEKLAVAHGIKIRDAGAPQLFEEVA